MDGGRPALILGSLNLRALGEYASVLVIAFAAAALVILSAGKNPIDAFVVLVSHALGTSFGFHEVVVRAIPLTLAGLGVAIAFRANVWNIGADGQIIIGAVSGMWFVHAFPGTPSWLIGPLYLLAAIIGGGAYGGLAGYLRAKYKASEIIVTIMLNYIALHLLGWVIRGPLQESGDIFPRSARIPEAAMLDALASGSRVHMGLFIAAGATVLVFVLLRYSSFGYQVRVVGASPAAARYGGINDRMIILLTMALSGGLAGLAGAGEIAALHHRLMDDFAPGFGIAAIAIALMARLQPLAIPFTALLFGILHVGSGALQRKLGIPFPIVWIIEGIVIVTFLLAGYLRSRHQTAR